MKTSSALKVRNALFKAKVPEWFVGWMCDACCV